MSKKKIAAALVACAMITAFSSPVAASAHGHCRRAASSATLCSVDDCNKSGAHTHNGVSYKGHYIGDGHDYHVLCDVSGCSKTGTHTHSGTCYMGHYSGDGHSHGRNHH